MPAIVDEGAVVTVYAGPGSDTSVVQPASLLDVEFDKPGSTTLTIDPTWRSIAYVLDGSVEIGTRTIQEGQVGVSHPGTSSTLTLTAADGPARALVFSGLPIGEPVVQYGPFVMNTQAEIRQAFADYQRGQLARPAAHVLA